MANVWDQAINQILSPYVRGSEQIGGFLEDVTARAEENVNTWVATASSSAGTAFGRQLEGPIQYGTAIAGSVLLWLPIAYFGIRYAEKEGWI